MDEFDFDDSPRPSPASPVLSATSASVPSTAERSAESSPQKPEPPSPLSSTSSPPRGRTKARRSRKVVRTGAQALAEAAAREERINAINVEGTSQKANGKAGNRKRALKETLSSSGDNMLDESESSAKHAASETAETPQHSVDSKMSSSASEKSSNSKIYGRRHKKRKSTPASQSTEDWDGTDNFQMKADTPSNCVVDRILNKSANKEASTGSGTLDMGTPPTPATPPSIYSGGNRSVRFSLSSNTKHYYKGYGTPPSTLQSNESADLNDDDEMVEICSASSQGSPSLKSKDDSESGQLCLSSKSAATYLNEVDVTEKSKNESNSKPGSDEHESAFVLGGKSTKRNNPKSERPALQGCLKPSTRQPQRKRDPTESPSPTKSDHSASSYGSVGVRRRKHRSRFNGTYTGNYQQYGSQNEDGMYHSNSPETVVALGRRDDIQDVGSYRMMIDDLSYLCSAILGCRKRYRQQTGEQQQIIKHNTVTAGAACDLAETISQSEMQTALLVLGGQKNNVGALNAVLEAVACAPHAVDWIQICKEVVEGDTGKLKSGDDAKDVLVDQVEKSSKPVSGGRTKSARRKQNVTDSITESGVNNTMMGTKCFEAKDKYCVISSNALSLVAHFVSAICTSKQTNSNINKAAIKSARNAVLAHKASLKGIARLILDDPVVDAYLRQEMHDVYGADALLDNHAESVDSTLQEDQLDDQSVVSCGTASSRQSSTSAASDVTDSNNTDPTKFGRRKGRRKKPSRLQQAISSPGSSNNLLGSISEIDDGTDRSLGNFSWASEKVNGHTSAAKWNPDNNSNFDSFSFASDDASNISKARNSSTDRAEQNSSGRYQEKIASALSRAKLSHSLDQAILASDLNSSQDDDDWTCSYCSVWQEHLMKDCDGEIASSTPLTAASIALNAADRIISGRDKSVPPNEGEEEDHSDEDDDNFLDAEKSNDLSKNPILFTNEMMRKSGSLPDYSRSMASTIASLLVVLRSCSVDVKSKRKRCIRCITYLQHRVSTLSEIIDTLCCLSPEVTKALSLPETMLIPSLLQAISKSHSCIGPQSSFIAELSITALKTLTTLTHENKSACMAIITFDQPTGSNSKLSNGIEIIFRHLHTTVTGITCHKSYDEVIFCLNILTNVAETIPSRMRDLFIDLKINDSTKGITWLTEWIVSKTSGFQRAIMKGSFGSTQADSTNEYNDAELQSGEEGNLVTAGNGFVLLAYLMLDVDNGTTAARIRDIIIKGLPIDEHGNSGGIQFMIKSLKAFCNFYHYSVGDLSVAVIAPVIKLITGLERIDLTEQRANWL